MTGWIIVPKGTGDLAARVGVKTGTYVALSVFPDEGLARKMFEAMPDAERASAEVVQVEVNIQPGQLG